MKLNIAENIRKLRRGGDLTQEQLAEKLGVSFQTVSRWETGVVYPDIELLPTMAELFGVTVDELMGCAKNNKRERLDAAWNQVRNIATPEEQYTHLKKMRDDFKDDWEISQELLHLIYANNFHRDDLREIVLDILENCTVGDIRRDAVFYYVALEDEQYITKDFLVDHAGGQFDKEYLMRSRYLYREEWDKYEVYRKNCILLQLEDMFDIGIRTRMNLNAEKSLRAQQTGINIINSFCDIVPSHPVSGDGDVDLWFDHRFIMGFRLSCALASTGKIDDAIETLEDTVSMIEKLISLPDFTVLSYRSHSLEGLHGTIRRKRFDESRRPYIGCEGENLHSDVLLASVWLDILTREHGWEWFDPIRDDERYKPLVRRLEKAQEALEASV